MSNLEAVESCATSLGDGSISSSNSFRGSENICADSISDENILLEDWESYWNDLNIRLTVSRMVSDSVIRGIVNAVVQESEESNSSKEAEITRLTERLQIYEPDTVAGSKSATSPVIAGGTSKVQFHCSGLSNCNTRHLGSLNIAAEKHLQLLKSGVECIRSSNYCKMVNSGSENFGFCCFHGHSKVSDNLTQIDKSIDALGVILSTMCQQTGEMTSSLTDSLCEQQWQCEFKKEVDTIIFQSFMKEQREEFDMQLCKQKSLFDSLNNFWLKKVHELSNLHQELDSISKSILRIEPEHSFTHASHELFDEWSNTKRKYHFPRKLFGDNIATDASHKGENGFASMEKSEKVIPDVVEPSLLQHMSNENLASHYQNEINKIKRQLEASLHEKTDELYRLKRELLNERGSLHCRRDKVLESLKKKFPEVILKLDKVLLETKKFSAVQDHHDKTCCFKQRIESLVSENRRLCDLLVDKRKEADRLSSQASDAAKKCSTTEENHLKEVKKLKWEIEDVKAEAFIKDELDKCFVSDLICELKCQMEDLHMQNMMIEEFCGIMLRRSILDAYSSMNPIMMYDEEKKLLIATISEREKALDLEVEKTEQLKRELASLAALISEKESALALEVMKSEKLNQEIVSLLALLEEENNNFISEVESRLVHHTKQLDILSVELNLLKDQASEQKKLISEDKRETNLLKARLDEVLNQSHQSDAKISELNQRLTIISNDLKEAEEQKAILCDHVQQKQNEMLLVTAQVDEQTEQLESIVIFAQELSKSVAEFESTIMWNIERRSSRLALDKWIFVKHCYQVQGENVSWFVQTGRALKEEETNKYLSLMDLLSSVKILTHANDSISWNKCHGKFFVKELYKLIDGIAPTYSKFNAVWKVKSPLKVKAFMWLVFEKYIVTKMYRQKWKMDGDTLCCSCHLDNKDVHHLIISCPICSEVWKTFAISSEVWKTFGRLFSFITSFKTVNEMWKYSHTLKKQYGKCTRSQILNLLPHAI